MKTKHVLSVFGLAIAGIGFSHAQTVSTPLKNSNTSVHSSTSSNSTYQISISDDDQDNGNVSVSISNSDDAYKFKAKFPNQRYPELLECLEKEMNKNNLTQSKGNMTWISSDRQSEIYTVHLTKTKLTLSLDKKYASQQLFEKFERLGKELRTIIVGKDMDQQKEAARMQREADRLRRDAERMRKEAERIEREAERRAHINESRYKADAQRIETEAIRLAELAKRKGTEASHLGGISEIVQHLLTQDKTTLVSTQVGETGWIWPQLQVDLLAYLSDIPSISMEGELSWVFDESGIYVNGTKMNYRNRAALEKILQRNKVQNSMKFDWYKKKNHMVLVDHKPSVDLLVEALVKSNILTSSKKPAHLEINGNSARLDGLALSSVQLKKLNELLLKHGVIAAPGKQLKIVNADTYSLGYSAQGNVHLGSWFQHR